MLVSLLTFSLLFAGCNHNTKKYIVTINDNKLYLEDFLYEIYQTEIEGNQLEAFYQKKLGYSYWDYEYNGITMRELAKNSVFASVVMYDILSDQAKQHKVSLTQKEIQANKTKVDNILATNSEDKLTSVGLTREVISNAITKIALGDKYKEELCKDFIIDKNMVRSNINQDDYSTTDQYEKAVDKAINVEIDKQFTPIYEKMKSQYHIDINYNYWDTLRIGSITVQK